MIIANLVYNDFFVETPEMTEARLVQQYEVTAEQSMALLNNDNNNNYDDVNNTTTIPQGCESTVLIIRHCEDLGGHVRYEDGSSHCSYLGFQRSVYFATLFGSFNHNYT